MENLNININPDLVYYPIVNFNYITGLCEILGESYMEETYKFYEPVIAWLRDYTREGKPITFNLKLTYFNTSSSRFILEMLEILRRQKEAGGKVEINWFCRQDDPDIITEINDFMEEAKVSINIAYF